MNTRDILPLYDYNYWATRRILAASAQVSAEQFLAPTGHGFGSLRSTLVHTLDSECGWRMLCQHQTLAAFGAMVDDAFPTFSGLEQRWHEEERAMRDYLVRLSDNDLTSLVRYTTDEGHKRERLLWHCLLHLVNHGTQHRSEAAAILTAVGHSPGDLDFTVFLNERGQDRSQSITIVEERPDSTDAVQLMTELDTHLHRHLYPPESRHAYSVDKLVREGVAFFVARYDDMPAGCGGLKLFGAEYGEIKRMFVRPAYRGFGLGKAMLNRLAEYARERQVNVLRLETGIYQTEAIGLYESAGFQRRPPFGEYKVDPLSIYYEKSIA